MRQIHTFRSQRKTGIFIVYLQLKFLFVILLKNLIVAIFSKKSNILYEKYTFVYDNMWTCLILVTLEITWNVPVWDHANLKIKWRNCFDPSPPPLRYGKQSKCWTIWQQQKIRFQSCGPSYWKSLWVDNDVIPETENVITVMHQKRSLVITLTCNSIMGYSLTNKEMLIKFYFILIFYFKFYVFTTHLSSHSGLRKLKFSSKNFPWCLYKNK